MSTKRFCDTCEIECTEDTRRIDLPCHLVQAIDNSPPSLHCSYIVSFDGQMCDAQVRTVALDLCPKCHTTITRKLGEAVWALRDANGLPSFLELHLAELEKQKKAAQEIKAKQQEALLEAQRKKDKSRK